MAEIARPHYAIPDSLAHLPPDEQVRELLVLLRLQQDWMAQQIDAVDENRKNDERFDDERVAKGLRTMQGEVTLDRATKPNANDILYSPDGIHAVWGQFGTPSPTDPGTGPAVVDQHTILDGGTVHTDSASATVTKGSLIVGNSTPKWDELVVGTDTHVLTADSTQPLGVKWAAGGGGATDHGALTGLTPDDDHPQYFLLAGRASTGGQIAYGGTAAGDDLQLHSTSNATKGDVTIGPSVTVNSVGKVGVNKTVPTSWVDVVPTANTDIGIRVRQFNGTHYTSLYNAQSSGGDDIYKLYRDSADYVNIVLGNPSIGVQGAIMFATAAGGESWIFPNSGVVGVEYFTLPSTGGDLVTESSTQTLYNKTLDNSCRFISTDATSGVYFRDGTGSTKQLRMILSGCTAGTNNALSFISTASRTFTFPDVAGTVAVAPTLAKGTLAAGLTATTWDSLPIGTDTHVLTADSTAATGMKWAAPPGAGSGLTSPQVLARGMGA